MTWPMCWRSRPLSRCGRPASTDPPRSLPVSWPPRCRPRWTAPTARPPAPSRGDRHRRWMRRRRRRTRPGRNPNGRPLKTGPTGPLGPCADAGAGGRVEEPEEPVRAPPEGPPYAPVLAEAGPAATRPWRITSPSGCGRFVALLAAVVVVFAAMPAVLLFHGSQRNRLTVTEAVTPLSPSSTRAPGAGSRPASTSCSRRRPRVDRALQREGTGDSWTRSAS